MSTPLLNRIAESGNRSYDRARQNVVPNKITCRDGFELSVIAGEGTYCTPRPSSFPLLGEVAPDYAGPYTHVEVGYPTERPEPWECSAWRDGFDRHEDHATCDGWVTYCESPDGPAGTVYAYVPVEMVRALIESHGGEA